MRKPPESGGFCVFLVHASASAPVPNAVGCCLAPQVAMMPVEMGVRPVAACQTVMSECDTGFTAMGRARR